MNQDIEAPAPRDIGIDPFAITRFDRDDEELEGLFVFCCAVANKTASVMAPKVNSFLSRRGDRTPFEWIRSLMETGRLEEEMRRDRIGKYELSARGFRRVLAPDAPCLRTASTDELETIPGVGRKTARFFVVHSRADARNAVIDTHMMKFLRDVGTANMPATALPDSRQYPRLEAEVLRHADGYGLSPSDFDLRVWTWYARKNRGLPPAVWFSPSIPLTELVARLEAGSLPRGTAPAEGVAA